MASSTIAAMTVNSISLFSLSYYNRFEQYEYCFMRDKSRNCIQPFFLSSMQNIVACGYALTKRTKKSQPCPILPYATDHAN